MKSRNVDETWEETCTPFQELILSWNGKRPSIRVDLWVRLKIEDAWSPWQLYASWGNEQRSYRSQAEGVKVFQDVVQAPEGKWATGFHIRTTYPLRLHVYTGPTGSSSIVKDAPSIFLEVPKLSQMTLSHPRHQDLCSPTSTAAVVRYLGGGADLDPVAFADQVRDFEFDIFGNWVLNAAQASHYLGPNWDVWVEKLCHQGNLRDRLTQGTPVIVSVRGPLIGSAQPYARGHLLVVRGMDQKKIYVMDPAFENDEKTYVSYPVEQFLEAWERRGRIAYVFQKLTPIK